MGRSVSGGAAAGDCGFLDGFTSQASSSNPRLSLAGGGGAGAESESCLPLLTSPFSFGLKAFSSITSLLSTAGAGRPFLVLFLRAPPGPEKRPPLGPSAVARSDAMNFGQIVDLKLAGKDSLPDRPYLVSKYFMTRSLSPSLKPSVPRTEGVISGNMFSSIESLANARA